MAKLNKQSEGRVRGNSPQEANEEIDNKTLKELQKQKNSSKRQINKHLEELHKEWDIEKTLEVNASSLALTGLLLGTFVNKRWFILPGIVATFLLQHGLQGWCPPLPLFRKLGIRTRQEIDEERYALKILRGDFDGLSSNSDPQEIQRAIRS